MKAAESIPVAIVKGFSVNEKLKGEDRTTLLNIAKTALEQFQAESKK